MEKIKLTQTVTKGGCAAKVPAMVLREILAGLKFPPKIDGVIIDGEHFDDAAIFKIDEKISLVQTLDFFTPIVDTPYEFGAIAAANALSDVYAMGGQPKTCMAILAAPITTIEQAVIREILQGASDVIQKAGASLVGGHSIDDDTIKFGLSVTGIIDTSKIWSNSGAQVNDILILTKPLGTGTVCAGIKRQEISEEDAREVIESMKRLNCVVNYLDPEEIANIHAATDVTGFGLAGHSYQLAKASNVSLEIEFKKLPQFKLATSCLEKGYLTKAHRSNDEYTKNNLTIAEAISSLERKILFDPQTSGGLLLSVDRNIANSIVKKLSEFFPATTIIGKVTEKKNQANVVVC